MRGHSWLARRWQGWQARSTVSEVLRRQDSVLDLEALVAGVAGWAKTRRRRRQTVGAISAGVAEELRRRQINRNDCVPRALAVFALATRSGRSATFVSGVTRDGADLVGHAWVVVEGRPLGATDAAGRTYEPQFCYSNEGEEVRPG